MQNDDSLREIYSELIVVLSIRHVHTDTSTMPFTITQVSKWTKDKTAISMHVLYQSQTCEKKFNITIVLGKDYQCEKCQLNTCIYHTKCRLKSEASPNACKDTKCHRHSFAVGGNAKSQPVFEDTLTFFLQELSALIASGASILLLGINPEELKTC